MQESASAETAEEDTVDDPSWTGPDAPGGDSDEDDSEDDADTYPEPKTKRRRVRDKRLPAKLSKCPHCFREFTNLKHHINQQHSQVGQYSFTHLVLKNSCLLTFDFLVDIL